MFGFDFQAVTTTSTTAGNITVTDPLSTQIITGAIRQNIGHVLNGGLTSNSKTFSFNWTAPATSIGNITFYATGNAANNNNNAIGDYIYSTTKVIPPAGLVTGIINGSPFCAGAIGISIPYSTGSPFNAGNIFTAQLSDAAGSFTSATTIGTLAATTTGTIISTLPLPSIAGTGYRMRIMASSPTATGTTNSANLTINLLPTTANAGTNQSICSSSTTLAGNTPLSGTGIWTLISGAGNITSPTNPLSTVTGLGAGSNIFQWAITSAGCSTSTSTVLINSSTMPTLASAGSSQTVCNNFSTLSGNIPTSGTGLWSFFSGSGSITTPTNPTTTVTNLGSGLNILKWTISNAPCPSNSSTVAITYTGSISISNAGIDQTVCATSATLSGTAPTAGAGAWSLISGAGIISNTANPTSALTSLGLGANIFRWTITNGVCTPTFDDVTITSVTISPANAGVSQSLCATSTTLGATTPIYGTGLWTVFSGGASITTPTSATTNITGLTPGVNIFSWTVSNSPCSPSSSTVSINQSGSITNSNAGPNQLICITTTTLAGNLASIGTGSWTLISGGGTIASPTLPNSTVSSLSIGNNVFRWTITNGACVPSISNVTVTASSVSTSNAGANQNICNTSTTLTANSPTFGIVTWSLIAGTGSITAPLNPTTTVTGLGNGINIFRWIISNPPCINSVSDVTINNCAGSLLTTNSILGSPFCNTTSYSLLVSFTTSATFLGFYTAQLSDATGSFSVPVAIGSGPSSPISAVIPAGSTAGSNYRIRVINSNPLTIGNDNGTNLSINTCNPNSIKIDSISGSPFCSNTTYNVIIPLLITGSFTGPFVAELSDASGSFALPISIGYSSSSPIGATIPSGMPSGVNYKIRIRNSVTSILSSPNNSNLSINTCGVNSLNELSISNGVVVYPNPSKGDFYLECKKDFKEITLNIQNILGEIVYEKTIRNAIVNDKILISTAEFKDNIYILKIKTEEGETVQRLIKY